MVILNFKILTVSIPFWPFSILISGNQSNQNIDFPENTKKKKNTKNSKL